MSGAVMKRSYSERNRAFLDAVFNHDYKSAKILLDEGADINARDTTPWEHGETALMIAVQSEKDEAIVLQLLEWGADVNARDERYGRTALMYKVNHHLIKYGADVNAVDHDGLSVLEFAILRGNPSEIKILLSKGALITDKEKDVANRLAKSTYNLDYIEIAELLNKTLHGYGEQPPPSQ
jgi:ankyrin repeat protein